MGGYEATGFWFWFAALGRPPAPSNHLIALAAPGTAGTHDHQAHLGDRTLDRAGDAVERVVHAHLRRPARPIWRLSSMWASEPWRRSNAIQSPTMGGASGIPLELLGLPHDADTRRA